jgi:hypothetical protein
VRRIGIATTNVNDGGQAFVAPLGISQGLAAQAGEILVVARAESSFAEGSQSPSEAASLIVEGLRPPRALDPTVVGVRPLAVA